MEWGSARALARSPACLRKMPELLRGYPPPENALESRQTDSFMPS
jgi:hypothetical protein